MISNLNKYLILAKDQAFFVDAKTNFHIQSLEYSDELNELDNLIAYAKKFAGRDKLGILISDDLVYVFSSKIKFTDDAGKAVDEKLLVENKIKSKIPEEISEVVWDYKAKQIDSDNKLFQIAVTNPLTTVIISKLFESDLDIDFVEPICYALARSVDTVKETHIIVSANLFENCIIISDNKYINLALAFDKENFAKDFSSVLDYVSEVFPQENESQKIKIYASNDSIKDLNFVVPQGYEEKYELVTANVNLFSKELLDESQHHGKNEDVLNLIPTNFHAPKVSMSVPHIHMPHVPEISLNAHMPAVPGLAMSSVLQNKKILIIAGVVLFVGLASFGIYKYFSAENTTPSSNQAPIADAQPAPVEIQTTETETTPPPATTENSNDTNTDETVINTPETAFSTYRLLILNGSGIPGEASKISKSFTDQGFRNPDIGNYPSGTIKQTTIRTKSATPDEALNKATELLTDYDVTYSTEFLDPTSPYDLEIVIGETRL
jgi:hypothetical protein